MRGEVLTVASSPVGWWR